jgi:hypothetical protein
MLELILGLFINNIANPLCSFLVSIYKRPNKFWKLLLKDKDISIVLTEYPIITKKTPDASWVSILKKLPELIKNYKIVKKVTDGSLVSKGNAKALSNVMKYLSKYVTNTREIFVEGDNYSHNYEDLVILGSPVNNDYARRIFSGLIERYDIPFEIKDTEDTEEIEFVYKRGGTVTIFKPKIDDKGNGHDYAIIVNAEYEISKNVVILAGAYMYGTEAASNMVTNEKLLKTIINAKKGIDINNCIFLIKTQIVKHVPKEPILVEISDNNYYIFSLRRRN